MKAIELEKKYEPQGENRGGMILFSAQIACNLIDDANQNSLKILGIDAFRILETQIQPIQDFSNNKAYFKGTQEEFVNETKQLILKADKDIRYEVVISD